MGNRRVCDAWNGDVLFQNYNGGPAKHSPARNVDNDLYRGFSQKSAHTHLRIRYAERTVRRLYDVVDPISLYLDCFMGDNYAVAKKNAKVVEVCRLPFGMRFTRICFWRFVCSGTDSYVRA